MKNATLAIVSLGALIWCFPLAVNIMLIVYQFRQGNGSIFIIALGILPYAVPLVITVRSPLLLLRSNRVADALTVAIIMFVLAMLAALFWVIGVGSS
jgi:hypothetical protein